MRTLSPLFCFLCAFTGSALAGTEADLADPLADKVIVNGSVPDEAARAAIVERLRTLYGPARVIDQLQVGGVSAPPKWTEYTTAALSDNLPDVRQGKLTIDGTRVSISGSVGSGESRDALVTHIAKAYNETYTVDSALTVRRDSQAVIDDALAGKTVAFRSGSDTLTAVGRQTLDDVASVIAELGHPAIQVIGHTDSTGNRLANIGLSLARANAVSAYLVGKGVPSRNLTALGAGPDNPIATNATAEGRAANRRIEFRIVK